MKKVLSNIMCLFIVITVCSFSDGKIVVHSKSEENITTVTNHVSFIVMDSNGHPISNAKIIIVNMIGDVIAAETSDKSGQARKKLIVPVDKRYYWIDPNKMEPRGTVTAIVFKEGYREQVVFEVPVSSAGSLQQINLFPIIAGQRNEPDVSFGDSHHLEILSLVDKYSEYLKK